MDILNIESVGLYKCNRLISKSDYARTSEAYEIELYNGDCEMIINGIEYKVGIAPGSFRKTAAQRFL